ncbi:MAG: carboxypeptidase-like regulatory domain-containing protein, partial [Gammaproteobacteria bacterium]
MRRHLWICLLIPILLSAGCGGGGSSSTSTGSGGSGGNGGSGGAGSINGLVTDSGTGGRLSGVTVTSGNATTKTGDDGQFILSGLADGTAQVAFTMDGYAPDYDNADVGSSAVPMLVSLKQQGDLQDYHTTQTATLYQTTENGPYAVTFTPNSLDTTDTDLHVSVTPLDPTSEISALPGDLV